MWGLPAGERTTCRRMDSKECFSRTHADRQYAHHWTYRPSPDQHVCMSQWDQASRALLTLGPLQAYVGTMLQCLPAHEGLCLRTHDSLPHALAAVKELLTCSLFTQAFQFMCCFGLHTMTRAGPSHSEDPSIALRMRPSG